MGTIKTTNIETITGSGTLTLGQSGETISVPSGATLDLSNATQTGVGGANTPAFLAILSGDQSISTSTLTALQFNTEVFDTDNCFNTSTYKFTPTTSGKYFVYVKGRFNNDVDYDNSRFVISKNGSQYAECRNTNRYYDSFYLSLIMEFNGSTDYINAQAEQGSGVSQSVEGTSTHQGRAEFGAYKLIGV